MTIRLGEPDSQDSHPEPSSFRAQSTLTLRKYLQHFSHPSRLLRLEATCVVEHENAKDVVALGKTHVKDCVGYRPRDQLLSGTG